MTIEPRSSPYQRRQINHLATDRVLAKDRLFAFITSFDEVVIALFIAGPRFTLPKKMFDNLRTEVDPTIAAVSTLLIALSAVFVLVLTLWLRRVLAPVLGGLTAAPELSAGEP